MRSIGLAPEQACLFNPLPFHHMSGLMPWWRSRCWGCCRRHRCRLPRHAKLLVRYQKLVDARFRGTLPRQAVMHAARFCPCPEGDSPSAKRQYDAVIAGCVPVVASDDALWAFSNEAGLDGPLDPSEFALHVPEAGLAQRNASLLEAVDAAEAKAPNVRRLSSGATRTFTGRA